MKFVPQENFKKEVMNLREMILALDLIRPPGGTRNLSKLRPRLDGVLTIQMPKWIREIDFRYGLL